MSKRQLKVTVRSLEKSLAQFKATWEKAAQGEKFEIPIEILSFENSAMLIKMLSPRRLALLQALHQLGKVSSRQLAKQLERDHDSVYQDVTTLKKNGILLEDKRGKYYVPWDTIVTEISLCTERLSGHRHHPHYSGSPVHVGHG